VPKFVDGIVEYVDRIKAFAEIDRLSLCFVDLDKCEKHVKLIALFGTLGCTPAGYDLCERGFVIFVGADRPDFHALFSSLVLRYGQRVDAIVFSMSANELHEGHRRRKSKATTKFPPATSNLARSRLSTFDFGAALWTSSIELQWAVLMSLYPRASGCPFQNSTSVLRAMTLMAIYIMFPGWEQP
jgi:hypothetical protein